MFLNINHRFNNERVAREASATGVIAWGRKQEKLQNNMNLRNKSGVVRGKFSTRTRTHFEDPHLPKQLDLSRTRQLLFLHAPEPHQNLLLNAKTMLDRREKSRFYVKFRNKKTKLSQK